MNFIIIYTTCSSEDEAKQISKILLDNDLIACSNILPTTLSMFKWDNNIPTQNECTIFLKTIEENYDAVSVLIKENHAYERPCIISIPIKNIDKDFGEWIYKTTKNR